ncbi:MAG: hypothetical protein ACUVXA_20670, partial [Candidatus Jordarchaeum sp.]|uniref:hypothetical protein n=1 Tax=Candidatus Jordarchaeum sp. TaxID=2823881 RepID=UPI00404A8DE0
AKKDRETGLKTQEKTSKKDRFCESIAWIAFKNTKIGLDLSLSSLSGAWSFYEWGDKITI